MHEGVAEGVADGRLKTALTVAVLGSLSAVF